MWSGSKSDVIMLVFTSIKALPRSDLDIYTVQVHHAMDE
jgi:hypothetical protein